MTDQRRRKKLIEYVTDLLYSRCSFPSSKLVIEGKLRLLLSEKLGLPRLNDHVQDDEDLLWPLEDLQEAILNYRVRSQPQA